jgi:hypothetical protein
LERCPSEAIVTIGGYEPMNDEKLTRSFLLYFGGSHVDTGEAWRFRPIYALSVIGTDLLPTFARCFPVFVIGYFFG